MFCSEQIYEIDALLGILLNWVGRVISLHGLWEFCIILILQGFFYSKCTLLKCSKSFMVVTTKIATCLRILGFFFAIIVLNQFGLGRNLVDVKVLSEWGIPFLLFEMGLELSLARLNALAKFSFGMGLTQVVLSTLAFSAFELPPNGAVGTRILEFLFHSRPDLPVRKNIRGAYYHRKIAKGSAFRIAAATANCVSSTASYP